MAQRFGGKYSNHDTNGSTPPPQGTRAKRIEVDPASGRAKILFIPAIPLVFMSLNDGAQGLALGLLLSLIHI